MEPNWARVLHHFALGDLIAEPSPVSGGWVGRVWRIVTPDGTFALKELPQPGYAAWQRELRRATVFESRAWSSGCIPMPEPLRTTRGYFILNLRSAARTERYRLHHWVEGEPCLGRGSSPDDARSVGASVARMLALPGSLSTTARCGPASAIEAFSETVDEATAADRPWAAALAALHSRVEALRREAVALQVARLPVQMCHRDLDPKNSVALPSGKVAITDWDHAGMGLPASEVLVAALSFAGGPMQAVRACLDAFREGYVRAGGPVCDLAFAAIPAIQEGLNWLMYNAWLALGHRHATDARRALAEQIVGDRIAAWPGESDAVTRWARDLGAMP